MNRAQLVELLSVERHLPLPSKPKPGLTINEDWEIVIPRDSREIQHARQLELDTAVESFNHDQRNKDRRNAAAPRLVKRGLIYVGERGAA